MVDPQIVEREALSQATADWHGIWELLWWLNAASPSQTVADREQLAADALRHLREIGYITFARQIETGPPTRRPGSRWREAHLEYVPLATHEVEAAIQAASWR